MSDNEQRYMDGNRMAWLHMLQECIRQLGITDPEIQKVAWASERLAAIHTLRMACDEYGDNDWEPNLHLSDIIDKHLVNYINEDLS